MIVYCSVFNTAVFVDIESTTFITECVSFQCQRRCYIPDNELDVKVEPLMLNLPQNWLTESCARCAVASSRGVARGIWGGVLLMPCGEDNATTSTDRGGESQKSERNGVS